MRIPLALLSLLVFFLSYCTTQAQSLPDSSCVEIKTNFIKTFYHYWCISKITMQSGEVIKAYTQRSPYSPEGKLTYYKDMEMRKETKGRVRIKYIKYVDSFDQHFEKIHSKGHSNNFYLARQVEDGALHLFVFTKKSSTPLPIPIPMAGAVGIIRIPYEHNDHSIFFIRTQAGTLKLKRASFRKQLSKYVQDAPALLTRIRNIQYKDIPEIVSAYNQYLAPRP
ncbi:MAG: hypothetical protein V4714_17360 [Bacteroidota bacterium]